MTDRPHRDFLAIPDFSRAELLALFDLAERMRRGEYQKKPLAGKTLAMIFMKASTRTRVSFEVGTYQLGGHALFLSPRGCSRSARTPSCPRPIGNATRQRSGTASICTCSTRRCALAAT